MTTPNMPDYYEENGGVDAIKRHPGSAPNMFDGYKGNAAATIMKNASMRNLYESRKANSRKELDMEPYRNIDMANYNPTAGIEGSQPPSPEGSAASSIGDGLLSSGSPWLMAAGGAAKIYGAYQDNKTAEKAAREERRRFDRNEAHQRGQARMQNQRLDESHNANMRDADFGFGANYQDRLLAQAAYKGV